MARGKGKKIENVEENEENGKTEENEKLKGKALKEGEDLFFFFFFNLKYSNFPKRKFPPGKG